MKTFTTNSAQETQQIAAKLAKRYRLGGVFTLSGPLGAGKTTFVQGLAKALGIKEKLLSPTFILMRQYSIPGNREGRLFHLDLYRLNNTVQIKELGIEEIFSNPNNIVVIEWAEKLAGLMPKNTIKVNFKNLGKKMRQIELTEPESE